MLNEREYSKTSLLVASVLLKSLRFFQSLMQIITKSGGLRGCYAGFFSNDAKPKFNIIGNGNNQSCGCCPWDYRTMDYIMFSSSFWNS